MVGKMNFVSKMLCFLKSNDGPTVVEYAILLGLIVIICLTSITAMGANASTAYTIVAKSLGN